MLCSVGLACLGPYLSASEGQAGGRQVPDGSGRLSTVPVVRGVMIRLIRNLTPSDPTYGLGLDEALFASAYTGGVGTIRAWINDRAVVIGRGQRVADEVDLVQVRALCIPVLRRLSGGGAVYHYPGNLNISLYLGDPRLLGGVKVTYARLGKAVAHAISHFGVKVTPEGNNLFVDGKKIGGAAQARKRNGVLYHTTLLISPDTLPMDALLRALRPGYDPHGLPSHPHPVTTLSAYIDPPATEEIADQIATALAETIGQRPSPGKLSPDERKRAERLAKEKYSSERWNRYR